ncbi:MAG: sigma-70 family RNA polymerase sigma factor [Bacteroidales bacterium]|nr:sigma-70 family RNA polymerase sigma factor [Bacteroidales bacterium]
MEYSKETGQAAMAQDYLTEAFIRLRQKLKGVSGRILPDPGGVEDVLQDSFVRLWRRQYPIGSEKEAEALLTRTVRNASLNERRRMRTVPLEKEVLDDSPGQESREERERTYDEMHRKIEKTLTETQRFILEEKEYGGRTLENIAKELKMEPAAVRMQLSRARKTLRETLNNTLKDER